MMLKNSFVFLFFFFLKPPLSDFQSVMIVVGKRLLLHLIQNMVIHL